MLASTSLTEEETKGWKQAALALKKLVVKLEAELALAINLPQSLESAAQNLSQRAQEGMESALRKREKVCFMSSVLPKKIVCLFMLSAVQFVWSFSLATFFAYDASLFLFVSLLFIFFLGALLIRMD